MNLSKFVHFTLLAEPNVADKNYEVVYYNLNMFLCFYESHI